MGVVSVMLAMVAATQPAPPPHLSIMTFYGFNESEQCGWTNVMWQELGQDQAFKKNLSVALEELVSFNRHCNGTGFVQVPLSIMGGGTQIARTRSPFLPFSLSRSLSLSLHITALFSVAWTLPTSPYYADSVRCTLYAARCTLALCGFK